MGTIRNNVLLMAMIEKAREELILGYYQAKDLCELKVNSDDIKNLRYYLNDCLDAADEGCMFRSIQTMVRLNTFITYLQTVQRHR